MSEKSTFRGLLILFLKCSNFTMKHVEQCLEECDNHRSNQDADRTERLDTTKDTQSCE